MAAAVALASLPCAGCHWLAGNPDATINSAVIWRDAPLARVAAGTEEPRRVWVRVRAGEASGSTVRVLAGRVRQVLMEEGWQVVEERNLASVWLDLDIRFWGQNPARDEAVSTYDKVLRGRRPDVLADGETARGGRFSPRSVLTPAEAVISALVANVVEFDFIVDLHVRHATDQSTSQEKQTLVVWARKIDLQEQEAAVAVSERVQDALRAVFRRLMP